MPQTYGQTDKHTDGRTDPNILPAATDSRHG